MPLRQPARVKHDVRFGLESKKAVSNFVRRDINTINDNIVLTCDVFQAAHLSSEHSENTVNEQKGGAIF